MLEKIKIFFKCKILGDHNWTCAAEQGENPTEKQVSDGLKGFKDYATMYCKDCGKISKLSHNL